MKNKRRKRRKCRKRPAANVIVSALTRQADGSFRDRAGNDPFAPFAPPAGAASWQDRTPWGPTHAEAALLRGGVAALAALVSGVLNLNLAFVIPLLAQAALFEEQAGPGERFAASVAGLPDVAGDTPLEHLLHCARALRVAQAQLCPTARRGEHCKDHTPGGM